MPSEVTTTYLEMLTAPGEAAREAPRGTSVMRSEEPTASFYRFLYHTVGEPWHWLDRRQLSDDELLSRLADAELYVLYDRGTPAGYSELVPRGPEVKLEYFGLMPEFVGRGLGGWFLEWTVRRAWNREAVSRVWVHTCTLDHPAALPLYRKVGFQIYDRKTEANPYGAGPG
ncbi:MAG: GNAT family N-acetyltransferase [Candidatus Eremiobacterota bacterium]